MRRLIVCADGTWNRPGEDDHGVPAPTNVEKMRRAISAQDSKGVSQFVHYQPGVGTGDVVDRYRGGILGDGLDDNIIACYQFLVNNYVVGDEIYLFGFSRGAYTVRSLAGLIRNSGILKPEFVAMVPQAFDMYRNRDASMGPNSEIAQRFRSQFAYTGYNDEHGRTLDSTPIECIGVWDTVGALGIPLGIFSALNQYKYSFHDVSLSSRVKNAFHALAIDERRRPFSPTIWTQPKEDTGLSWLEQAWFTGVHSNVGGGYADQGLSDVTFEWMMQVVSRRTGLEFNQAVVNAMVAPNELGRLYDSMSKLYETMGPVTRVLDEIRVRNLNPDVNTREYVHASAKHRAERTSTMPERWSPQNYVDYTSRPDALIIETLIALEQSGSADGSSQRLGN